ncbi:MAG: iron-sulfur cluster assembly scaffold protein [Clostridia bacterium]|nr:iron-sulfur cluster assembly scaffold protein [Clostridia bacterium]
MYSDKIMQIFANPKNVGTLKGADATGEATNEFGEVVKIFINAEDGIITDAKFKAYGSVVAIASGSTVTTLIKGKFLDDAINVSNEMILESLGGVIDKEKIPSLKIAREALLLALKNYKDKFGEI